MSALYPSLEDMKVDQMAQVCVCLIAFMFVCLMEVSKVWKPVV